ncbi:MAG TPA: NifU N-terminal domain-containing protein [Acidimicrobiales bacterium]|nr:NifU N-terminal domain-containing protein [Acidimicrobiales bacterium]
MATASPQPSPNPNALRFQLNVTLPGTLSFGNAEAADAHPFAKEVFGAAGVASIFGVNDFVTVNRTSGAEWEPIIAAVQAAAAEYL